MPYPHPVSWRIAYLQSLPDLSESQKDELRILLIIEETDKSIEINKKKDQYFYGEVVRNLQLSNGEMMAILNSRYDANPLLF